MPAGKIFGSLDLDPICLFLDAHELSSCSIRTHQQYRMCFTWENGHAYELEITETWVCLSLFGIKGDVVVSSHAVQFDLDLTAFGRRHGELADHDRLIEADPEMVATVSDVFDEILENDPLAPALMVGTVVSGDSFVSDPKTIKWLQREFSAACTEMEGGAVAYTCKANEIPFVIVRIISDSGGKEAAREFERFVSKSSDLLYRMIARSVERF